MITSDSGRTKPSSSTGTRPLGGFRSNTHADGRSDRSATASWAIPFSASAIRTRAQYGQRAASISLTARAPSACAICS